MNGQQNKQNFDLLVIPQTGHTIPADHLTDDETEQARADWTNYGTETAIGTDTWTIHIAHIEHEELKTTSIITIPRTQ